MFLTMCCWSIPKLQLCMFFPLASLRLTLPSSTIVLVFQAIITCDTPKKFCQVINWIQTFGTGHWHSFILQAFSMLHYLFGWLTTSCHQSLNSKLLAQIFLKKITNSFYLLNCELLISIPKLLTFNLLFCTEFSVDRHNDVTCLALSDMR